MSNFSTIMAEAVTTDHGLRFHVDDDWGQGRTVFGGMQGAMAVKAMRRVLGADIPLRSLQITFVGPVSFGDILVSARVLRQGRSATQVQAEIYEGDKLRLIALGIFGSDRESEAHNIPETPECRRSVEKSQELSYTPGMMPTFTQHFVTRIAESLKFFSGDQHPKAVSYARHRDDDTMSDEHLTALGDIAPPVAMAALSQFAPASSMNWQLEFVQQPEQVKDNTWFRVDAELLASGHGYCWQNTNFWDEQNRLVMLSRQCVAIFG